MATLPFNAPDGTRELVSQGNRTIVSFVPCGINIDSGVGFCGADSTTSVPKGVGYLCTLESMDAIPIEALQEETIRWTGKNAMKIFTGAKIPEFNLMLDAGDIGTLQVMSGKNPSDATARAWIPRPNMGLSGHLIIRTWAVEGSTGGPELITTVFVPNMSMKITEIPSTGPDVRRLQMVTFYKEENADIFITKGKETIGIGFHKLISGGVGTGVPATAPDGAITSYVVGTGNVGGIAGATSPVPLKIDDAWVANKYGSSAPDLRKYMLGVWVSGVAQSTAQVTYTTGTRTLAFTTAPLITDSVMYAYIYLASTALSEVWTNNYPTTVVEFEQYGWQQYA